jgi:hypothetical protein
LALTGKCVELPIRVVSEKFTGNKPRKFSQAFNLSSKVPN